MIRNQTVVGLFSTVLIWQLWPRQDGPGVSVLSMLLCSLIQCSKLLVHVFQKQVEAGVCMSEDIIEDALDRLRGAVTIVYPMNLPPYDPIRMEFEGKEELGGTQAGQLVMDEAEAQLWWAGKQLVRGKKVEDFVGKNDKTKVVCKLQKVRNLNSRTVVYFCT